MLQEHHVCDATTSCDAPSRSIRTSEAEDTFTSCQLGLDHPISRERMLFEAPPPPVMEKLLMVLRRRQ